MRSIRDTRFMQYVTAITASISITMCGMLISWSSPSLPILSDSSESPIGPITVEEGSWVASIILLTPLIVTYPIAWMLEKIGRVKTLLIGALPFLVGGIIVIYSDSFVMLLCGRGIAGFGIAFGNIANSMYIGEIADKDIRGKLGTTYSLMKLIGYNIVMSTGPFVSYEVLGWIMVAVPIFYIIVFFNMPESPYYLMKIGKPEQAKQNYIRLSAANITPEQVEKKMAEIESIVNNDMKNSSSILTIFKREYIMSLLLMIGIKTLQQFCGTAAIDSYMQTIVDASGSGLSPELSSVLYGVIQLPSIFIAAVLVDRLGRKPILMISAAGCAIALIAEGLYFFLQDNQNSDVSSLGWLPTSGLVLFAVMNNFGLATLPYILLGEIFATNVKEMATSLSIAYGSLLAFLAAKFFEPLSNAWGRYTMFWIFAGTCVLGFFFVWFFVPETKGRTFAEIQESLNGKKKEKKDELA